MVTTDAKNALFFYLVTTETEKGQGDFFRQLPGPLTEKKRRLSFATQRIIWVKKFKGGFISSFWFSCFWAKEKSF